MKDWYTVPTEYGGRSLPFYRRLYFEWLWRRHGRDGLDRHLLRISRRIPKLMASLDGAIRRMTVANWNAMFAMDEFAEVIRRGKY